MTTMPQDLCCAVLCTETVAHTPDGSSSCANESMLIDVENAITLPAGEVSIYSYPASHTDGPQPGVSAVCALVHADMLTC